MKKDRERVLLTGATGKMGYATFVELLKKDVDITLLIRSSKKNKKMFRTYTPGGNIPDKGITKKDRVKIVWGDLTNYDDVLAAVKGVDIVLHPGAFVAPAADHNPKLAQKINVGGTENIVRAILAQPNGAEKIRLIYIASVAMYGDRLPPIAQIRTGDPIVTNPFDFYGTTKVAAERAVIESGIKHWATWRQTYICIPDAMSMLDPIMYHQPIEQHIEIITVYDAGLGLANAVDIPEDSDFWRRVYNMGAGPKGRMIYINYIDHMMNLMGMGSYKKIMDRNWFAIRNFHCGWYEDSDVLDRYVHCQRQTLEDHYQQVKDATPWYVGLGKIAPKSIIKMVMKSYANKKDGPLYWVTHPDEFPLRIKAFWGSLDKWKALDGWENIPELDPPSRLLDHGYDDSKEPDDINIEDCISAAKFRGGECLSRKWGGLYTQLKWKCAFGHEFEATPALVLLAGQWCPQCEAPPWNGDAIAKKNPFYAQVWYRGHSKDEANFYSTEDCLKETF